MMKALLAALTIASVSSGCARHECELCGRWQSDAERTLAEMENSPLLSDRQRRFFRKDFYGRLIVDTRATETRGYFPEDGPDGVDWDSWHVVRRWGDSITIEESSGERTVMRSITLEGDCYRVDQPNLGFGEWFCKLPEQQ